MYPDTLAGQWTSFLLGSIKLCNIRQRFDQRWKPYDAQHRSRYLDRARSDQIHYMLIPNNPRIENT